MKLIHQWVDGRIPVIGVGSVFTADDALDAIESTGVELVALGREILLDYNFISKIESTGVELVALGREILLTIISSAKFKKEKKMKFYQNLTLIVKISMN